MAKKKPDGTQRAAVREEQDLAAIRKSGVSPFEIHDNGAGAVTRRSGSSITGGKKPGKPGRWAPPFKKKEKYAMAGDDGREEWDLQPGEKTLWYDRFLLFLNMGPKRTKQGAFNQWRA